MSEEDIKIIILRYSNASTADMNFSSDDEAIQDSPKFNFPEVLIRLDEPRSEVQMIYFGLTDKLQKILAQLEEELESVDIREYRTIAAQTVKLNNVFNSKLCRRRSTLPILAII